ncbi:MAG TPA: hypothetical protein VHC91_03430 [Trinickia sp.]|jgi:hypothetical protein|uniref:hypothetical protein n=1 Tax=Trinickia sp. TaxID=2571163 RepID=UPI002B55D64C|nr:hypothetical protein [Trinickia sp.]HVW49442.1 hypothetical protein [Trinickia sp.]
MPFTVLASPPRRAWVALLPGLAAVLGAAAAPDALAQYAGNPGDIIVERAVMPRDAFKAIPKNEDPVAVRATTFPAPAFNTTVGSLVSDADLTQAHGSQGVASNGSASGGASLQALTKLLGGSATGSNVAMGPTGAPPATVGIGGTLATSVTGALAPLTTGLAGLGGFK